MTTQHHLPHPGDKAFLKLSLVIVAIVVAGVIVSRFAPEIGLTEPNDACRAVVADVATVDRVRAEDAGFQAFSEALRVAIAARHACPVRNTADGRVLRTVDQALDAYSAYRESWQAELEGAWDETLSDPVYWRANHPSLMMVDSEDDVSADEIERVATERGVEYLGEALDQVER